MKKITFGIGPVALGEGGKELRERFAKLLARTFNLRVTLVTARSYTRLMRRCLNGELDLAWLPPAVFVRVMDQMHSTQLLLGVERRPPGFYRGAIFARPDSDITTPEDLEDTVVAWVDPNSAAGFLFPRFALMSRGLHPDRIFAQEEFFRSHEAVVRAVESGNVDVGATYVRNVADDPSSAVLSAGWTDHGAEMRVVLETRTIPHDVVCAPLSLGDDLQEKVVEAFSKIHEAEDGKAVLRGILQVERFVKPDPAAYQIVRSALNVAHLPILGDDLR
jgi:phosphate/phosphite/phosphonate ABC transporter binding protein